MATILDMRRRRARVLTVLAAFGALTADAQAQGAATVPTDTKAGAGATRALEWDVVSVHPAQSCTEGSGMQINHDGVHIFCVSLRPLVQIAWGINEASRVIGSPGWATETQYNIEAKVTGEDAAAFSKLTPDQRNQMLQALLRDRFKLAAHLERRELPVYGLVVEKGGPKLKEAQPDEAALAMIRMKGRGEVDSTSMPVHSALSMLSRELDRPVVDQTGLTGNYDYVLRFTPAMGAATDAQDPSIFTAVEEQLGLKLEPTRAPLDVLIVEHVEKPAEN